MLGFVKTKIECTVQCTVCIPQVINIVCRFCRLPWVRSRSQLQSQVAMSEYSYPRVAYHCEDEDMEMKANESQASKNRADKTSHRSRRNMNGKACSFGQKHKRLFFLPPPLFIHDEHTYTCCKFTIKGMLEA